MYFADFSAEKNFNIYKNLLDTYLERHNSEDIRIFFQDIIKTAHLLATSQIVETKIDNTIYNLVTSLVDHNGINNRQYFQNIDPNNIGEPQFKTLSGILSSLVSADYEIA